MQEDIFMLCSSDYCKISVIHRNFKGRVIQEQRHFPALKIQNDFNGIQKRLSNYSARI